MAQKTRAPTSDFGTGGTIAYSSGSTGYTLVNDYPDTADPLTSYVTLGTTANSFIAFGFSAFDVPTAGTSITSVVVDFTDEEAATGVNTATARIRVNGTYYDNASNHNPSTTTTTRSYSWTTNPATGAAWTVADVNGTGTNPLQAFGVIGADSNPTWRIGSIRLAVNYNDAQTLTPSLADDSTDTFYAPTLTKTNTLSPALASNTQTFYAATVAQSAGDTSPYVLWDYWVRGYAEYDAETLQPALASNSATFYAPTVAASYALTPALVTNTATFYAATVTPGVVTLTPARADNTNAFYAATVAAGSVSLTPALYSNSATFYAATVSPGAITLTPGLVPNTNTFYAATVSPGAVTLTPARVDNAAAFYAPTVAPGAVTLAPGLLSNSNSFYAPSVAPGLVTLSPDRYDAINAIYAAVITQDGGPQYLLPSLYENFATFYTATVEGDAGIALPPHARLLSVGSMMNRM